MKCSICGAEISKRKSYAMPDGSRACKHHQEAQDANANRERHRSLEIKRSVKKAVQKEKRDSVSWGFEEAEQQAKWVKTHCNACGKEHFPRQKYFLRLMVNMEKIGAKSVTEIFGGEKFGLFDRMRAEMNGKVLLHTAQVSRKHYGVISETVSQNCGADRRNVWDLLEALEGFVYLCSSCTQKLNATVIEPEMPTVEQLDTFAMIAEASGFNATVKDQARRELILEN